MNEPNKNSQFEITYKKIIIYIEDEVSMPFTDEDLKNIAVDVERVLQERFQVSVVNVKIEDT